MPLPADHTNQLPLFHVVGFSGHRQLADPAGLAQVIQDTLVALSQKSPGEWVALSSVAIGSDQAFVRKVLELGLSWHAILPLPRTDFAMDFSAEEWLKVEKLLDAAEHVRVITENGSREDAYLDCGMETVNGCDVLLAVWDSQPARGKGGTADVVEYAIALGKPVIIIDAATFAVRSENMELFNKRDDTLAALNKLPAATTGWGENPFKAPNRVFAFQQKCDHAASNGAPQFRRLIVSTVLLHVVATLVATAALAFGLHILALPWIKLMCLAAALGVALLLRSHHHHHSWVRCRLAAEFCRSALATWGLPRAAPFFEDLELPAVGAITRALHILHSRSANTQPVAMEEFKRIYLEKRINDQLAYYRRQENRAVPLHRRLKVGFWVTTLSALLCTAAYAVCETWQIGVPEWVEAAVFYFMPISLPVVAASFISLVSINDLQRRVARYREMHAMLTASRQQVAFCQTWNSLERIVLRTERALLQEVLEWHSITSFSESH